MNDYKYPEKNKEIIKKQISPQKSAHEEARDDLNKCTYL